MSTAFRPKIEIVKRIILPILTVVTLLVSACADYKSQIAQLQKEIDNISDNLDVIETVTANLGGLRDVLAFYQADDRIVSVTPSSGGFVFVFKNNGSVEIGNQTAGVSVGCEGDTFFWTLNGSALKSSSGTVAVVSQSPKFRARENAPQLSCDGSTWADLDVNSAQLISKVDDKADCIEVTFLGGTVVAFAKYDPLRVSFSGDGSTLSATGELVVDYLATGGSGSYTILVGPAAGLSSFVKAETQNKGVISFVRQSVAAELAESVLVYVCDGAGNMVSTSLDFASLTVDESFPVMSPVWEAYGVAAGGGTVEVELNTNLDYEIVVEDSASWLSHSGSKALRTDRIAFSAAANDSELMRSAAVTFTSGTYTKTVVVYQDGRPRLPGQDLSASGTANCYIVPTAGDYYFDATVIGNGDAGIMAEGDFHVATAAITPAEADLMMEYSSDVIVENIRLESGKICFHATGAKGNVTVYAGDADGRILWSWHLWCTDMPAERVHTNGDGSRYVLLDRNLGATSADPADGEATYGLYYQWGRKDPFSVTDIRAGMTTNMDKNIEVGVRRPYRPLTSSDVNTPDWVGTYNNYLWGNPEFRVNHRPEDLVKSIYDPCPAGYMVPPPHVFSFLSEQDHISFVENGFYVRGDYGQQDFYPFSGSVYTSSYNGYGSGAADVAMLLWNSCAARLYLQANDGGAVVKLVQSSGLLEFRSPFRRAAGVPVRCVKQQAE